MIKKKALQIVVAASATLLVCFSVLYYAKSYITDLELIFTTEHKLILLAFSVGVIIMASFMGYLLYRNVRLEKLILTILDSIADIEDNNIRFNRVTQNMIMKLNKDVKRKFGVSNHVDKE
jgi:uncharacterized membrane protein YcjF (UPF0283 family)